LVATEGDQLRGIDTANGSLLWEFPLPEESGPAMLDARQRILYSASQLGIIEAYRLPAAPADEVAATNLNDLDFLWSIDLDLVGIPLLLPLPNGGIVIFAWGQMLALSSEGDLLWEIDDVGRPFDWIQVGDQLLVSSLENGGSLLSIDAETAVIWEHSMGGILEATNGHALLYEKDGVYQLDLAEMSVELLLDLPGRRIDLANILALSGGNILLSHLDPVDQRLILLDSQGNMLWQRSTVDLFSGETKFFELGGQAYLLAADEGSDFNNIRIYAVDKSSGDLTHLFSGGSRSAITGYSDFIALPNDQLLVNIGGRSVTAVDLKAAAVEIEQ